MGIIKKARRLFPPSGAQYELWDCAVFVAILVGVGYVIESPQPKQAQTLTFVEQAFTITVWGSALTACAVVAIVCSYRARWLAFGYGVLSAACAFWGLVFLVGVLFYDGTPRSLTSALIYGWVFRRLVTVKNGKGPDAWT